MEEKEAQIFQTAVILAGGRSSRMGFDKQLLKKDKKHLAVCLAEELETVFQEVLVVTNTPELYEMVPVRTCQDIYPGLGPISGMHSAFYHSTSRYIFVLACDMTRFSPKYARYQARRMLTEHTRACVTMRGEKMEPFHGFYERGLLPLMEERLKERQTSVFKLLQNQPVTRIDQEDMKAYADPELLFRNLNTPQDYRRFSQEETKPS